MTPPIVTLADRARRLVETHAEALVDAEAGDLDALRLARLDLEALADDLDRLAAASEPPSTPAKARVH